MFAGEIVWKKSLKALEQNGAGLQDMINTAYHVSRVTKDEPIVVSCWSSSVSLPSIEESRAIPLVVLALPSGLAEDTHALLTSPLHVRVVENLSWAERTTCLEMAGKDNVIQLRCDSLLPAMRATPLGAIIFVAVCGDDVLLVEHFFDRRIFLAVCSELHQDNRVDDETELEIDWRSEHSVVRKNSVATFVPLVTMQDDAEEFSYGAVRSGKSDSWD
jgi:hypothetical protein